MSDLSTQMHELAMIAAQEWARENPPLDDDPVKFGYQVALAYVACQTTRYKGGDKKSTLAALASLSVPLADVNGWKKSVEEAISKLALDLRASPIPTGTLEGLDANSQSPVKRHPGCLYAGQRGRTAPLEFSSNEGRCVLCRTSTCGELQCP